MPTTLGQLIKATQEITDITKVARETAANSAAFFMQEEVKDWILSEGEGSWPKKPELSTRLRKGSRGAKKGKWVRARSKQRKAGALRRYAGYSRYIVQKGGDRATIGFSIKPKPRKFSKLIEGTVAQVQSKRQYQVNRKVQKALAASKSAIAKSKRKKAIAGKDYFAPKLNSQIDIPARPIVDPVADRRLPEARKIFELRLTERLNKERQRRKMPLSKFK